MDFLQPIKLSQNQTFRTFQNILSNLLLYSGGHFYQEGYHTKNKHFFLKGYQDSVRSSRLTLRTLLTLN